MMGKTTNNNDDKFGGSWTREKLIIIEKYLKSYCFVLKNRWVKTVYVDAFAGSGKIDSSDGQLTGSALNALKYDFAEFHFIEIDEEKISNLKNEVQKAYPSKFSQVVFHKADCNKELSKILIDVITPTTRAVVFLDPFSTEVSWEILVEISKNHFIDLWYLFPLRAIDGCFKKDGFPDEATAKRISKMLGTNDWESQCYLPKRQMSIFEDDDQKERIPFNDLVEYFKRKLATVFPHVHKFHFLKNTKNSSTFLLCFFMTNESMRAQEIGTRLFDGIMQDLEKMKNQHVILPKEGHKNEDDDAPITLV